MTDLHHVVFKGQLTDGISADTAKQKLAGLFKISPAQAATMLSGKSVYIKKNVDIETAKKYQAAMHKVGALAVIVDASETISTSNAQAPQPTNQNNQPVNSSQVALPGHSASSAVPDTTPPQTQVALLNSQVDTTGLSMATAGAELQTTTPEPIALVVDLTGLSLAEPGAVVLSNPEIPPTLQIDTSGLSLDESFT